jgi:hypothetical protein
MPNFMTSHPAVCFLLDAVYSRGGRCPAFDNSAGREKPYTDARFPVTGTAAKAAAIRPNRGLSTRNIARGELHRIARSFRSLIQIKTSTEILLTVPQGNDADQFQHLKRRDTACPLLATIRMDGRAAGAWKSLRFCF